MIGSGRRKLIYNKQENNFAWRFLCQTLGIGGFYSIVIPLKSVYQYYGYTAKIIPILSIYR